MQRSEPTSPENTLNLVMRTMKWGLIPSWSKHEDKTLNTINARSENLVEGGGMWGSIKGKKRCVVLCQGYFEWLKKDRERLPYFIKHKTGEKGQLMLLAGLYDCTVLEGSTEPLWTFTIVTVPACNDLAWLHDRQPVILSSREALETWLDTSAQAWTPALTKLVKSYDNSTAPLECYQVPKEVGKVGTESPTFIEPIANRKDGIQAMFLRQKQAKSSLVREASKKRKRSSSPSPSHLAVEPSNVAGQSLSRKLAGYDDDADASPALIPKTKNSHVRSPPATRNSKGQSTSKYPSSKTRNLKGGQITHFFPKT